MPDTKISALPGASTLAGTEIFPAVQGGATVGATLTQAGTYVKTAYGLALNHTATTDPAVGSDSSQGYAAGSSWLNTATGLRWTCRDASVGAAVWHPMAYIEHPGFVVGNWYPMAQLSTGGGSVVNTHIKLMPFMVPERVTISSLGVNVITAATSGNCQLALYASDPATKRPTGSPLSSTASIPTSGTGANSAAMGANVSLEPGVLYYTAIMTDNSTNLFAAAISTQSEMAWALGSTSLAAVVGANVMNWLDAGVGTLGSWPDLTLVTCTEQTTPKTAMICLLVASIP